MKRVPFHQQLAVASKITHIRARALDALEEQGFEVDRAACPTCCRRACDPYLRVADGRVAEGCVDAHHLGHLIPTTNAYAWATRPEAHKLRAEELRRLKRLG